MRPRANVSLLSKATRLHHIYNEMSSTIPSYKPPAFYICNLKIGWINQKAALSLDQSFTSNEVHLIDLFELL